MNRELDGAAAAAMELFNTTDDADVAAVYIVGGRRPSADDIRDLHAERCGLAVTVDQYGDICLRRGGRMAVAPQVDAVPVGTSHVHRVMHHLGEWSAGFSGISEGVR